MTKNTAYELVGTRRSTVLIFPLKLGFPGLGHVTYCLLGVWGSVKLTKWRGAGFIEYSTPAMRKKRIIKFQTFFNLKTKKCLMAKIIRTAYILSLFQGLDV
jgi:hypothetical protein